MVDCVHKPMREGVSEDADSQEGVIVTSHIAWVWKEDVLYMWCALSKWYEAFGVKPKNKTVRA